MNYVVGFLFDKSLKKVLLQKKNRGPEGVAGKYNGHGGKIEVGEFSEEAISRETFEETGIVVKREDWLRFHHFVRVDNNEVYFFTAVIPDDQSYRQIEDELLVMKDVNEVMLSFINDCSINNPHAYNLSYLIPMARSYHMFPQFRYAQ
jgi:8-oxo-dGTP pyrophosphatase MutT (NUDIX family)